MRAARNDGQRSGCADGGGTRGTGLAAFSGEFPPLSAHLEAFRTLDWWRQQQRDPHGLRHPRHYPRLANLERDMHKAAQGDWRVCAQDREGWRRLEQGWVNSMDLPWASGKQTRIQDWQ